MESVGRYDNFLRKYTSLEFDIEVPKFWHYGSRYFRFGVGDNANDRWRNRKTLSSELVAKIKHIDKLSYVLSCRKTLWDIFYKVFPIAASIEAATSELIRRLEDCGFTPTRLQEAYIREVFALDAWDFYHSKYYNENFGGKSSLEDEDVKSLIKSSVCFDSWPQPESAEIWWRVNWARAPQLVARSFQIHGTYRCVNPGTTGRAYSSGPYGSTREEEYTSARVVFLPEGEIQVEEEIETPNPEQIEPDYHFCGVGDTAGCEAGSKQYPIVDIWVEGTNE